MIIDAHIHVWDKIDGTIANKVPVVPLSNGMIRINGKELLGMPAYMLDCAARAEYIVSEFNAAGVDLGVVVQDYMDGSQNAYVRDASSRFPERFLAHALPNFWNADHAATEALGLLAEGGFCGLKLPAEHLLGNIRLDDSRLMPIWEHLEESQTVLAVDLAEGEGQVAEMENILTHCPKLHVAIGHFGMVNRGGWPGQLRLAHWQNVYLETGGIVWLYRGEGYPFPGALDAICRARDEVGITKLMWGSDWPRTTIDLTYRQSLDFARNSSALSQREKTLLLGDNACKLYRIAKPQFLHQPLPLITEG